jgi:hypothetical protein
MQVQREDSRSGLFLESQFGLRRIRQRRGSPPGEARKNTEHDYDFDETRRIVESVPLDFGRFESDKQQSQESQQRHVRLRFAG